MLREVLGPCSIIRVQSWDGEALVPEEVNVVLGAAWPDKTGTVVTGRAEVICVGPTDWLLLAGDPDATSWLERINAAFQGSTFRATDVSQALTRIQIGGPEVRDLLAKGCSLDLHPPLFPPGHAARTRFAGMPVVVCCTGTSAFELIVTRSYTNYLLSWLADAELEFEATA
jgi:sarcosine oxidase subunit gamma